MLSLLIVNKQPSSSIVIESVHVHTLLSTDFATNPAAAARYCAPLHHLRNTANFVQPPK